MQSGATRTRQRESALPRDAPRSEQAPKTSAPGPRFAHDFTRVPVQAKLKVSTPGDALEDEADRAADCACGGKCSSCASKRIQRKASGPAPETANVEPILGGPSHALDPHTRSFMEPYFGHDFSRVRVHSDPAAAASADSLGARAYTVGHHLVFGPGQYRPSTAEGRRLLAHELTHVLQQNAAGPMLQRAEKEEKKKVKRAAASTSPKLDVKMVAKEKEPPCACLVFMHHDERNARRAAEAMYEQCHYNLAIVDPKAGRNIDIPNVGERDPNELFPRHIFRECHADDKPCQDFIDSEANRKSQDAAITEQFVQRQFFLAIKQCSHAFKLPIVALHTNVVTDTAKYREQFAAKQASLKANIAAKETELRKPDLTEKKRTKLAEEHASLQKQQADLGSVEGTTFQDKPPLAGGARPYAELESWLERHFPDLVKKRSATTSNEKRKKTWKKTIESPSGGLLAGGMTNIFKWCQAHDNSDCYIGDPSRPDNVVWVTRRKDLEDIRAKAPKANVALQTRVTPGESETDLSSMFVGDLVADTLDRMKREPVLTKKTAAGAAEDLKKASRFPIVHSLGRAFEELQDWVARYLEAEAKEAKVVEARENIRYINVETPQATRADDEALAGYRDVRTILQAAGLHCCDAAADAAIEKKFGPPEKKAKKKT